MSRPGCRRAHSHTAIMQDVCECAACGDPPASDVRRVVARHALLARTAAEFMSCHRARHIISLPARCFARESPSRCRQINSTRSRRLSTRVTRRTLATRGGLSRSAGERAQTPTDDHATRQHQLTICPPTPTPPLLSSSYTHTLAHAHAPAIPVAPTPHTQPRGKLIIVTVSPIYSPRAA